MPRGCDAQIPGTIDPTIAWLLDPENPCIRYFTLTTLLGRSSRDKDVAEARRRIPTWPAVARILAKQKSDGGWDYRPSWYIPKYKSSIWQLIILSQTGIDPSLPSVKKMCEYSFRFQSDSGAFVDNWQARERPRWSTRAGCLNGNVIGALCRLGLGADKRVRNAIDHLISRQERDGGWSCRVVGYEHKQKHSCFMGTVCALDAMNEYSRWRRSARLQSEIVNACEFVLMHKLFRADHHGFAPINPDWMNLRAPYLYHYDILRGLRALRMAGVRNDRRMDEALEIVRKKRLPNGRWLREVRWPSTAYSSFGRIGKEDKWVTLVAMQVLEDAKPTD